MRFGEIKSRPSSSWPGNPGHDAGGRSGIPFKIVCLRRQRPARQNEDGLSILRCALRLRRWSVSAGRGCPRASAACRLDEADRCPAEVLRLGAYADFACRPLSATWASDDLHRSAKAQPPGVCPHFCCPQSASRSGEAHRHSEKFPRPDGFQHSRRRRASATFRADAADPT